MGCTVTIKSFIPLASVTCQDEGENVLVQQKIALKWTNGCPSAMYIPFCKKDKLMSILNHPT
jgi:hypothetical protein